MPLYRTGLSGINGPLVELEGVEDALFEELVELRDAAGGARTGRVVRLEGNTVSVQVFEGTRGLGLNQVRTRFTGGTMRIPLSAELLGRTLSGSAKPVDGLGDIFPEAWGDIDGLPLNPVRRVYPRDTVCTGISAIDCLTTLIRGQKLPIFSGSGMQHNKLAVQIVRQAKLIGGESGNFCVVFAAMGIKNDVADYFRQSFRQSGALNNTVMLLNLASDPITERLLTPKCALTIAEYLAYQRDMHVLVVLTDMTSYAEALREFSSSKGEIPGRKGFPGYLYSDLASIFERAGIVKGGAGSVTQIPILTMPGDDITHPVPDLTGYITEGQIVLDRQLDQSGVYPPIAVLPSLSRLMKDGIGAQYTREDHQDLANQLFASYSRVQDARSLASVIGEEELSPADKQYLAFGRAFEARFLSQQPDEDRSIEQTLNLGWELLGMLPRSELDRVDGAMLEKYLPEGGPAMK